MDKKFEQEMRDKYLSIVMTGDSGEGKYQIMKVTAFRIGVPSISMDVERIAFGRSLEEAIADYWLAIKERETIYAA